MMRWKMVWWLINTVNQLFATKTVVIEVDNLNNKFLKWGGQIWQDSFENKSHHQDSGYIAAGSSIPAAGSKQYS